MAWYAWGSCFGQMCHLTRAHFRDALGTVMHVQQIGWGDFAMLCVLLMGSHLMKRAE